MHKIPSDLLNALIVNPNSLTRWESLTSLARNEWTCWVITVKKDITRKMHIERVIKELAKGKKRPCCWSGCIHRKDKI